MAVDRAPHPQRHLGLSDPATRSASEHEALPISHEAGSALPLGPASQSTTQRSAECSTELHRVRSLCVSGASLCISVLREVPQVNRRTPYWVRNVPCHQEPRSRCVVLCQRRHKVTFARCPPGDRTRQLSETGSTRCEGSALILQRGPTPAWRGLPHRQAHRPTSVGSCPGPGAPGVEWHEALSVVRTSVLPIVALTILTPTKWAAAYCVVRTSVLSTNSHHHMPHRMGRCLLRSKDFSPSHTNSHHPHADRMGHCFLCSKDFSPSHTNSHHPQPDRIGRDSWTALAR